MRKQSNHFMALDQSKQTIIEYVWINGHDIISSKSKIVFGIIDDIEQVPKWNHELLTKNKTDEVSIKIDLIPVTLYDDPFRGDNNKIVLCETYYQNGKPTSSNFRHIARKAFTKENIMAFEPWYGIEQEYVLMRSIGTGLKWPYGWQPGTFLGQTDDYYCANGAHITIGRELIEAHMRACLYSGIELFGINSEYLPSQWEFQVGSSCGIKTADDLIMARFLLIRISEYYNITISFEPKLFDGWCGSGGHCNFSTKQTRGENGYDVILTHMDKLAKFHKDALKVYGEGNEKRMLGIWDAPDLQVFTYGTMNRKASVRISQKTFDDQKGYYEDRRPGANLDPYIVTSFLFSVTCLDSSLVNELKEQYIVFRDEHLFEKWKS